MIKLVIKIENEGDFTTSAMSLEVNGYDVNEARIAALTVAAILAFREEDDLEKSLTEYGNKQYVKKRDQFVQDLGNRSFIRDH